MVKSTEMAPAFTAFLHFTEKKQTKSVRSSNVDRQGFM